MPNVFKPFGEKATDSFNQQFRRSRLILTLLYVAILAIILTISGGVTRQVFSQRLVARFHPYTITIIERPERMPPIPAVDDVRADLLQSLLLVNELLLVIAGLLSYWLAGITLRPIQTAYEKQRRFLSDASHELRTPLTILQTDLENEAHQAKTDEERHAIQSHLEEVQRMTRLVNDLLTLSRLADQPPQTEALEVVDLTSLLNACVTRLTPLAEKHHVHLLLTPTSSPIPVATPNEDLLVQAFTNVLHNAILYNKEEGDVEISIKEEANTAVITIHDTGIGMNPHDLQRVFDRFYRADKSRSRRLGGSGLGLSIVQSILHRIHGSITMESAPNQGTTITLALPIHRAS